MRILAVIFGLLIVLIVILADSRHLGFVSVIYDIPYGDKVGHFFLFGILSMVVNLAVFQSNPVSNTKLHFKPDYNRLATITSLMIALLVGLEEYSQRWFPSRTSSFLDLFASFLGISIFTLIALRINKSE